MFTPNGFSSNDQGLGQFRVNSHTAGGQYTPDATSLSDGGYVVAWNGRSSGQTGDDGVFLRHYGSNGETITETTISSTISGTQNAVQVTTLEDGSYVASWSSNHSGKYQVYARIFDADGQPQGAEFLINEHADFDSYNKDILALNDGGFLVGWVTSDINGAQGDVYARQYDAEGNAQGEPFMLNDYMGNHQDRIQLQQLEDGRIISVWDSSGGDGNGHGISGKLFSLEGAVKENAPDGTEVGKINVDDPDLTDTHRFELVDDADGRFVIDEQTGVVRVADADAINYEEAASHDLEVRVTDSAGRQITETFNVDVSKGSKAPISMSLEVDEGEPFALHAFTVGDQTTPVITALENGNLLAVWKNSNTSSATGGDGSNGSINARILDAEGKPQSPEFRVNETTTNDQAHPSVTTLANGEVLMTWTSSQSGNYRIYGRRYDEDGNALGGEFSLTESAGAHQYEPSISALADGGYLVSWQDSDLDGSGYGVFAQRFDSNDQGSGQFRVNTHSTDGQYTPDTEALPDGGYIITWAGRGSDQANDNGVYIRQYSADGKTIVETTASSTIAGGQNNSKVTVLSDGGYVVSWTSNHGGNSDVYARQFNAKGEPIGDDFRVSTESTGNEHNRDIIALDDGGFMVSWDKGSNGDGVYARRFNEYGEPQGEVFQLNDYMGGAQTNVQLLLMSDGRVATAWQSAGEDGSGTGVYGRYLSLDGVVKETVPEGTSVGRIHVNDPDLGDTHLFELTDDADGRFAIDPDTGVITVADPDKLSYQENPSHDVVVKITDSTGHTLSQTFTLDVAASSRAPVSLRLETVESEEFDLNAFTDGVQNEPALTALDNGGFLSVWVNQNASSSAGGDGSRHSVKARVFDENGEPLGAEFLVNQGTSSVQYNPSTVTLANGDVLVSWTSYHGGSYRVYGRRFDEDGNALTNEMALFESAGSHQYRPEIGALEDGGYIVSWYDSSQDGDAGGIYAQRFNADNEGFGQFRVNSYTAGGQIDPDVTGLSNGGYVITWYGKGEGQTSDNGVYLRQYNADGETVSEFTVSTSTAGDQSHPQITELADGGYVVTWSSNHEADNSIYARTFDSNGQPRGDEFLVSALTGDEYASDIISLNDGGFLVSWYGDLEGSDNEVYAQRFNVSGEAVGDSFRLNDTAGGSQSIPRLTELADGRIVAAWQSESSDGSGYGIVGKMLTLGSVVKEGAAEGTVVGQMKVDDPDQNDLHTYELTDDADGRFAIDANTGIITVVDPDLIDHSDAAQHEITVKVTDSTGNALSETIALDVTPANRAPATMSLERAELESFQLHTSASVSQIQPTVTALEDGGFLSVWRNGTDLSAQKFDGDGQAVGNEFQISQSETNIQSQASVTTLANGDTLVTWISNHASGGSDYRVYGASLRR